MIYNDDYNHFTELAYKIFYTVRSMVCKTNKYSELHLDLIPYNPPYAYCYGFSNDTNIVTIFLGNIVQVYDHLEDELKRYFAYRRDDYISSVILYSIIHELFHTDQIRYNENNITSQEAAYVTAIEKSADTMAMEFIDENMELLNSMFCFDFIEEAIPRIVNGFVSGDPMIYDYNRLTLETLIKQFLNTTIFRCYYLEGHDVLQDLINQGAENIIIKIIFSGYIGGQFCIFENGAYIDRDLYGFFDFVNKCIHPYENMYGDYDLEELNENSVCITIDVQDSGPFEPLISWQFN